MTDRLLHRRRVLQGGLGLAALGATPFGRSALAAEEGDTIIAAAKGIGKTDLKAIMWSNYFVPMKPPMEEFQKATGIGITSIKDLSTPTIPQAAMAEALTRSPDFDIDPPRLGDDPLAGVGRLSRAARRVHAESQLQDERGRRLRQAADL